MCFVLFHYRVKSVRFACPSYGLGFDLPVGIENKMPIFYKLKIYVTNHAIKWSL